jgi:hypothetical protein
LVEEELLVRFPMLKPQMTLWACLLDLPAHITAQYACTSQFLLQGSFPSTEDLQIPFLSLHSTISMPVKLSICIKKKIITLTAYSFKASIFLLIG